VSNAHGLVWTRPAQVLTALFLCGALALMAWHAWAAQCSWCRPTSVEEGDRTQLRLDLNTADHTALRQLPGVGDHLAQRIEDYRRAHGPFRSVDDLRKIEGIGPKMLERLRPLVEVTGPTSAAPEPGPAPRPAVHRSGKKVPPSKPLDLNTASEVDLQQVPGIGPTLAGRIVEYRTAHPLHSVDELRRVRGIGAKLLEQLRPHVHVAPPVRPDDP
jgi:competence protein ComEA